MTCVLPVVEPVGGYSFDSTNTATVSDRSTVLESTVGAPIAMDRGIGNGVSPVDWRSRPSFVRSVRRSASTPPQSRPPRYREIQVPVSVHASDVSDSPPPVPITTVAQTKPKEVAARAVDIPAPPTAVKTEPPPASGLGSFEKIFDATIKELCNGFGESVTEGVGRESSCAAPPVKTVSTDKKDDENGGVKKPDALLDADDCDYDFPPPPVPVDADEIDKRRPSAVRGVAKMTAAEQPKRVVTTVRQTVTNESRYCVGSSSSSSSSTNITNKRYNADDSKTGGDDGAKDESDPPYATVTKKRDDAPTKDEPNNAGSLVISWNDRCAVNTSNTLDASVRIGSGTVASRVNIFDAKQRKKSGSQQLSDVKAVTTRNTVGHHQTQLTPPAGPFGLRVPVKKDGHVAPTSRVTSRSVAVDKDSSQTQMERPSQSTSFLPPPPASWRFERDDPSHEPSSKAEPPPPPPFPCVEEEGACSSCTDMLKFKVDQMNRYRAPPQSTPHDASRYGLPDAGRAHVSRVDIKYDPRRSVEGNSPVVRQPDLTAIGVKLEKLIASIDQQNRNIQSITNLMGSGGSRDGGMRQYSGVYYPTTERDDDAYRRKEEVGGSCDAHQAVTTRTRQQPQKDGKSGLMSCIR